MLKPYTLVMTFCLISVISTAQFNYILTTSTETYANLTGTVSINNGEVWDDPEYIVNLPFTFDVNGVETTALLFVGLGSELGFESSPDIVTVINPFSVDLIDRGSGTLTSQSPISYRVDGTPGSRIFKIEWNNAGSYDEFDAFGTTNMFVNFQVWLYEGSNAIEFRFGPSSITDPNLFYFGESGAMIGVVDIDFEFGEFFNANLLSGPASDPELTDMASFVDGTPSDGMVYRLSVNLPVEVEVVETPGTCGLANGIATANATGGAGPYTYLWSNSATTQTITDLEEGLFSVTVTDAGGSTATGSVTVTNQGAIVLTTTVSHETAPGANDGTATVMVTNGASPFTYAWSNGGDTETITDLAPGEYSVTVTDAEACVAEASVTVNAFGCPELLLEVAMNNLTCFGVCDGTIVILEVINGTAPFSYEWNNGETTSPLVDICVGEYTVTVSDANGCTVTESFEIFQPDEVHANAIATNESSQGANDGSASSIPSGGFEPYTFEWSNGSTESEITGLSPGSYRVTVTDANACTDWQEVVVGTFACGPLDVQISHASCAQVCDGSITVTLLAAALPVTYFWSDSTVGASRDELCSGSYSVTATDADGCTASATIDIIEPTEVVANAASTNETLEGQNDGTAWAVPTGGTPSYTYAWDNGSTDSLQTGLAPGTYRVTVTDANGCTDWQDVEVLAGPCVILLSAIINNTCFEVCDGSISITPIGAVEPVTYLWSDSTTESSIINLCAGSYSVTTTDADGCVTSATYEVTQPDDLLANAASTNETLEGENDGTAWSAPTGGTSPYTYVWNNDSTTSVITDLAPGSYRVTVTDANGCTDWQQVEVLVGPCALLNPTIVNNTCFETCDGSISLNVLGAVDPVTYLWSDSTTGTSISNLCAGSYSVTMTDGEGCEISETYAITEPDVLLANAGSTNETLEGAGDGTAWSAPSGGTLPYTYAWSTGSTDSLITGLAPGSYQVTLTDANGCTDLQEVEVLAGPCMIIEAEIVHNTCFESCDGFIAIFVIGNNPSFTYDWNIGTTTDVIFNLCGGEYSVTVTDAVGCTAVASFVITEPELLVATATHTNESGPNANDGTASVDVSGGTEPYHYLWSTGSDEAAIDSLIPGTYVVTVVDDNGCLAIAEVRVAEFVCLSGLTIEEVHPISCFGMCDGALQANVNGGTGPFTYLWNTGDTIATIEGLCADVYTVLVSDIGQGCSEFTAYILTGPELLDFTVDGVVHVTDSTSGAIYITPFGGTPPYSFWWFGEGHSSFEEDLTGVGPEFYTLMLTDANDCEVYLDSIEILDNTVGVRDVEPLDVRVYPNPAQELVHLDIPDVNDFLVQLYTTDGQLVQRFENTRVLNVKDHAEGIFVIKVSSGQKQFVSRLTVMR